MNYKTSPEHIKPFDEPTPLLSQKLSSALSTPPANPTLTSQHCLADSPPPPFSQRLPKAPSASILTSMNEDGSAKQQLVVEPSWGGLSNLLNDYPSTASEVESMVADLQTLYPQVPGPFINYPDGPFPEEKPYLVCRSHLVNNAQNLQIAVENIKATGRLLDPSDEKHLHYILQFPYGWSATWKSHQNDSWVKYIQYRFPHVKNLQPILDDMTWPEEVHLFPVGYVAPSPMFMLFANEESFYLYYYEYDELLKAGKTLEEVYFGLRDRKWWLGKDRFFSEPDNGEEYNIENYFPDWVRRELENGNRVYVLIDPILDFKPHLH
jgi:hypothetical protein